MNFPKTLYFIFISLCVGLCFPSVSQSDSNVKAMSQSQNTFVEVNVAQNDEIYVSQEIQEDVIGHALKPRFEANWRYSNDRSILMGEFWLPLMQCEKESVLFCDIRLMGDDNENKEFNVGVGYREVLHDTVLGDGVAGAMIWFDRRFTDRDFQFNQVTVGGEWLGEQYDLRMNGYFPIDKNKSYLQANPNGSGQGFVGHQLLVNTEQVVVEEVLPGIDFEVGSQLNFMNDITDSTRFFVGGFHFEGDIAEDITGVRTRIVSDITSDVQIGARFQHDDVRGSQTYVESTIRFPFGHKKKYKHQGVWSRLDESPERDIDVVSNEVVTVQGINEPLLNAISGLQQNVIHVDNTAVGGGDGTIETPYNTLAAAEGAATANDMIYVHTGDGTTTNQNVGITLDDAGQMLAGSGTDLLYSTDRFRTPNGNGITGALVPATTAPKITNGAGNGVDITAGNVLVSGITVDGATSHGIYALNADNVIIDNVTSDNNALSGMRVDADTTLLTQATFSNNTASNNTINGFYAYALNNGNIETVNYTGNTAINNTRYGLSVQASGVGSAITTVHFTNNISTANGSIGVFAYALSGGDIDLVNFTGNTASNTTATTGIRAEANGVGSSITRANFANNIANNNASHGFYALAQNNGSITTADFTNNSADGNAQFGFHAFASLGGDINTVNFTTNTATNNVNYGVRAEVEGVGSTITEVNFTKNIANSSTRGIFAHARNNGDIGTVIFTNNTADNNTNYGLHAYALSDGDIGTVDFISNTATNNAIYGLYVQASGAGSAIAKANLANNTANTNGSIGVFAYAVSGGDIDLVDFTGNTATNTIGATGIRAEANGVGSLITRANFTNNIANNSGGSGFLANAPNNGSIVTADFTNNSADGNTQYGFYVSAFSGGNVNTVNFTTNTATNNVINGVRVEANGVGSTLTTANVTSNTSSSNMRGFDVIASNDGDIGQVSLEGNTSTNNSSYGINIDDDSAAGSIGVDLGGGAFGSAGNNRVFDNTGDELLVDLDGGNLVAENNWWGSTSGLVGSELTLQDASTADTTPFLTSDPE